MEKPLSRPRSHSTRRNPPHPNTLYDDVFGGPPRYGLPLLSPRTEDYLEIFGGFHAPSNASFRIPVLDLPLAVADHALLDLGAGSFDYSEVFGRGEGQDVGLLEFEVVSRSDHVGESSCGDVGVDGDDYDDAWTPETSDWLSEDSELFGYDRTFSNGNPYMSIDGEIEYEMSFHKANHGPVPFDSARHTSQIQSVPGCPYVVSEIPGITNKVNPHQFKRRTSNSVDHGMERVEGKEQKKVFSHSSSATSQRKSNDHDSIHQKQFGRVKSYPGQSFVTISEISLRTAPSNLPPPSRPPPAFDIETSGARGSTSSWKKSSLECDSLPDCFDVEVDGGSSAAAMRETMDKAQSQLESDKESTKRQKDYLLCSEMPGSKSDASSTTKNGSLFANSTINRKDDRVQYYSHTVNNSGESSMTDKNRNIAGENQDEVMKGKVVEGAVISEQIWRKKEGSTVHSVFTGDDRTGGACELTEGYDFFAVSKNSDQGRGIRGGIFGKDASGTKVNGLKSSEWNEARNVKEKQVENESVMIKEKEQGVNVMDVSEGKDLGKTEVIENHSDPKHAGKAPMMETEIMETRSGRSDTDVVENHGGLNAAEGYVCVFDSADRQSLEDSTSREDLMVSESNMQFQVHESLLSEKTLKVVIDREECEQGLWADVQHRVMQSEEKMASGSYGSAKEIFHYVSNDAREEDLTELVQNKYRLPTVVEQQKVKVLLAEHYPKESSDLEGARASAKQHNKVKIPKSEGTDIEADLQNEQTKLKADKNGKEVPLNWTVEQKENDSNRVNFTGKTETQKMLKTSLPEVKKKIMNAAYQVEEGDKGADYATQDVGTFLSESCRDSSSNLAAPEQGTMDGRLKEAEMYVHANESLSPCNAKGNTLEHQHENAGQHEAGNESDDDIEWEIIDEGLCEVIDVRELGFLNHARERIPVDEMSVPHYGVDARLDVENLSNSKTHPDAVAPQLNKHNVQREDSFNSLTTEMAERMDERASHHSKQDLRKPGSDIFKAAEAVHVEKYVDSRMMNRETAACADQTNYSISSEEEVMAAEAVEFKDQGELNDVPLHRGKEIPTSSWVNGGFDGKTISDTSLPDLGGGTAQQQSTSQPEEKKEKKAVSEARDSVRLSREQKAELERLRRIEEEKEREREREKDRMVVDKATLEAREKGISESFGIFDKSTVERGTAEASRRAMMEARERLENACAEARERLLSEKSAAEERLKLERAAVERAIAEARGRAAERAKADKSASDKFSSTTYSKIRQALSLSDNSVSGEAKTSGSVEVESARRCRARLERHQRTAERAAKALAEKNMRDLLAQREQAERSRLAETLDADVRRWSKGKEGNLRALLSTLQYILGPDSGWQPVPLTEVITSAAVKKAYRKATLCVHPDKLQQRGASIQQKYICEKVFDLLKEGWNQFNSEER